MITVREYLQIVREECNVYGCRKGCSFYKNGKCLHPKDSKNIDECVEIAERIKANKVTYLKKLKQLLPNIQLRSDGYPPNPVSAYFGESQTNDLPFDDDWNREYKEDKKC